MPFIWNQLSRASQLFPSWRTWRSNWSALILTGQQFPSPYLRPIAMAAVLVAASGCSLLNRPEAGALSPAVAPAPSGTAVDIATASSSDGNSTLVYTGTTEPSQTVTVRSQSQGQLLYLNVDVGDRVRRGQTIAEIDKSLPAAIINQAQAELSARRVEVAQNQSQIQQLQTQIEIAKLELTQAEADAHRLQSLYQEGAISQQDAELAQTAARQAEQALRAAQAQVVTQNQAIAAAEERAIAQQAIVTQAEERQSYTQVEVPISGTILNKPIEAGNIVTPGDEILRIGDFSQVTVNVQVSELDLHQIYPNQYANIALDAFPGQDFAGEVTRIWPAADPATRSIPVEVTIPNRSGRLGSGLLARVTFELPGSQRVWVPQSALSNREGEDGTLFVLDETSEGTVSSRRVILGIERDGNVEIVSGLEPGENYVVQSASPLNDGDRVELSILSK